MKFYAKHPFVQRKLSHTKWQQKKRADNLSKALQIVQIANLEIGNRKCKVNHINTKLI